MGRYSAVLPGRRGPLERGESPERSAVVEERRPARIMDCAGDDAAHDQPVVPDEAGRGPGAHQPRGHPVQSRHPVPVAGPTGRRSEPVHSFGGETGGQLGLVCTEQVHAEEAGLAQPRPRGRRGGDIEGHEGRVEADAGEVWELPIETPRSAVWQRRQLHGCPTVMACADVGGDLSRPGSHHGVQLRAG